MFSISCPYMILCGAYDLCKKKKNTVKILTKLLSWETTQRNNIFFVFACSAHSEHTVRYLDYKIAFLHGAFHEDLYMNQLNG